jgi:predicted Zn-dependent protease with MMP-like domain
VADRDVECDVAGGHMVQKMIDVPRPRFESLVSDALDEIPDDLWELMENVAVVVGEKSADPDLLGLYDGIPLTERDDYGAMVMPDRITIYRLPICRICSTAAQVTEQIRITVVHEVAHHFGIDDDRLDELGWA